MPVQTTTASSSWTYLTSGGENHWDQTAWEKQFSVSCSACPAADRTEDDLIFDLKGIDASVANALRRILLEEVPTMAIEHVFIINNTSILPVSPAAGTCLGCLTSPVPATEACSAAG